VDGHFVEESLLTSKRKVPQDPYKYLNEHTAIMLNCKDPKYFNEVYEKTIKKHVNE